MNEEAPRPSGFRGSYTNAAGERVQVTGEGAAQIWLTIEKSQEDRAARLPDEQAALRAMFDAFDRLREMGWRDAMYCPKDGTRFQVIEAGSTGIFDCHYEGKWPDGHFMTSDDHDTYLSRSGPILFRLYPEDEAKRQAKMAKARELDAEGNKT